MGGASMRENGRGASPLRYPTARPPGSASWWRGSTMGMGENRLCEPMNWVRLNGSAMGRRPRATRYAGMRLQFWLRTTSVPLPDGSLVSR